MVTTPREQATRIAGAVRESLHPSQILLFGSAARGTATADSDLDFCLVFDTLPLRKIEILRQARRAALPVFRGAIDFVTYSTAEWHAYLNAQSSFETKLNREAVAL
ncbi:MAG: nucleotidyltransferase domain-containing protein [Spirochaetales bacterium]